MPADSPLPLGPRGLSLLVATLVLAAPLAAQERSSNLVMQALAAGGGAAAYRQLRALEWDGTATIHIPGREIHIRGTWRILPPDTAVVTTWLAEQDSSTARSLVLTGERGWVVRDTTLSPMAPEMLIEERHQFYLYSLLRLLPLADAGVRLESLPPDSAGRAGILVQREGRLDVGMYFDTAGRVARMVTRFAAPLGQPGATQELLLSGVTEVGGVRWFRELRILRDGQPYFDLTLERGGPAATPATRWLPPAIPR